MTPAEIAWLAVAGYLMSGLAFARFTYRHYGWDSYTTEGEKPVFSLMLGLIWPLVLLVTLAAGFVAAPDRRERLEARAAADGRRRAARDREIRDLERELGIGQPVVQPVLAQGGAFARTSAAMLRAWSRR
jgi:hypothetical protein